jgi:hypothetical protein
MATAPQMTPPTPPNVRGQQGPLGQVSAGAPNPVDLITSKLTSIADEMRRILPLVQQVKPGAMMYFERGLQAFALGMSELQGESRPDMTPPTPPESPNEPPPAPSESAGPPLGGGYPGA